MDKKKALTYYGWKDDELSKPNKPVAYITNYDDKNAEGLQRINGQGYRKCTLICTGTSESAVAAEIQRKSISNEI